MAASPSKPRGPGVAFSSSMAYTNRDCRAKEGGEKMKKQFNPMLSYSTAKEGWEKIKKQFNPMLSYSTAKEGWGEDIKAIQSDAQLQHGKGGVGRR